MPPINGSVNPTGFLNILINVYMVRYQAAPPGFLVIEKMMVQILGDYELVLRLFPLMCGLGAILLFYILACRNLSQPIAIFFGLCVFISSEFLIYNSTELKPYSVDVAITLLLLMLLQNIHNKRLTNTLAVLAGIIASLTIWISFPSIFILSGGIIGLMFFHWRNKEWTPMIRLGLIGGFVGISFAAFYVTYLSFFTVDSKLVDFWAGTYMPGFPLTQYDIPGYTFKWFYYTFIKIFKNPVGLTLPFMGGILFLIGCHEMLKTQKVSFYLLLTPILFTLFTLAASGFQKYPFYGRMLLFLCPVLILFMAAGIEKLSKIFFPKWPIAVLSLAGLMVFHPILKAGYLTAHPILREEIKPCLAYLKKHKTPNDAIYVYFAAENAYRYYASRYGFSNERYILGTALVDLNNTKNKPMDYKRDLDNLAGRGRVWILFSHVYDNHESLFLSYLDQIGKQDDSFKSYGASVYLYAMNNNL